MSQETKSGFGELGRDLREARPIPEPGFTDRLDRAVADRFPPDWVDAATSAGRGRRLGSFGERLRRRLGGNRGLLPALAGAAGVLFVATVVAVNYGPGALGPDGSDSGSTAESTLAEPDPATTPGGSAAAPDVPAAAPDVSAATPEAPAAGSPEDSPSSGTESMGAGSPAAAVPGVAPSPRETAASALVDPARPAGTGNRDVAFEARITLGASAGEVQDVADEVVSVTDAHHGIVMDSRVTDGEEGAAGASFSLLIPTGEIDSAVADLSGIADLRSRSQEVADITAPTNRAEDAITDSKARIESLLGELERTYDEDERAMVERKIGRERIKLRYRRTRLNGLERRADYTPVALRVETGGDTADDDSSWGLADAVDDAGELLGVAAGVTVLALAVAIPIGIVILIALAVNRAWVGRSRNRALNDD